MLLLASTLVDAKTVKSDTFIDGADPGVRLFVRGKMSDAQTRFGDDNIVLFVHGATYSSTPDFDLDYKDYSWADWMVDHGYVVYLFDKRNYGFSSREKAMDEPARRTTGRSRVRISRSVTSAASSTICGRSTTSIGSR